jgi:ABC-type Zn uptake system ZnuABC Zn-binding protein ZnuA
MKRELYENFLLSKYIMMTMEQINKLEPHEKEYYVANIEEYLKQL